MNEQETYEALEEFLDSLGEKQSIDLSVVESFVKKTKGEIPLDDVVDYLSANGVTVIGYQREDQPKHVRKDDPLWHYIKEVGKVVILGKERELEVATRLRNTLHAVRKMITENTLAIRHLIGFEEEVRTRRLPMDEFIKATSGDPDATIEEKRTSALENLDALQNALDEYSEAVSARSRGKEVDFDASPKKAMNEFTEVIEGMELTARTLQRFSDTFRKLEKYLTEYESRLDSAASAAGLDPKKVREVTDRLYEKEISGQEAASELGTPRTLKRELYYLRRREKLLESRLEEILLVDREQFLEEVGKLDKHWDTFEECKRLLIEANVRLVINIAKNYTNQGVDFMDLIQEGNAALIKAVERFDPSRGYKLGTYAIWWIRQAMLRTLAEQSHVVKLPTYLVQWIRRYTRVAQALSQKLGREPTPTEVSAELEVEPAKSNKMKRFFTGQLSLNKSLGNDDSRTLEDVLPDESSNSPMNMANLTMLQTELKRVLETLTPKEQRVITLRFGLEDNMPRTLEEIGQIFDLSRERIRQIEMKALNKLRHPSKLEKLSPYLKE